MRQDLKSQIYDLDAKLDSALRHFYHTLPEHCRRSLPQKNINLY